MYNPRGIGDVSAFCPSAKEHYTLISTSQKENRFSARLKTLMHIPQGRLKKVKQLPLGASWQEEDVVIALWELLEEQKLRGR